MSDSDVEILTEETSKVGRGLTCLSERSQERYKSVYAIFKNWLTEKAANIDEKTLMEYFVVRNAKLKAAASLWAEYSILKATIAHYDSVDISKFSSILTFLKKKNEGYRPRKASVFTKKDFTKFLLEAPDEKYLPLKVGMIFGVGGACRREELYNMKLQNIQERNGLIIVSVPPSNTHSQRSFIVKNDPNEKVRCLDIYYKYINLRPHNVTTSHLFLNFRDGKCTKQVIGINTVGSWPSKIAEYLKLKNPVDYTGHSFRRSSATLLADESVYLLGLRRHGGYRPKSTVECYFEEPVRNNIQFPRQILHDGPSCSSESETPPMSVPKLNIDEISESFENGHVYSCDLNPFRDIKSELDVEENEIQYPTQFGNPTPESYQHILKENENLRKEVQRLKQILRGVRELIDQDSDPMRWEV